MKQTREILLNDNQDITRIGMEALLLQYREAGAKHVVTTKKETISRLVSTPNSLVIIDYSLSDFGSADELLNVSTRFDKAHWLLFSDELSNDFLRRVLFGSMSFSIVLKSCAQDEISMAITHALVDERYICARVTNQLLMQKGKTDKTEQMLTATEKEIVKEIALGRTTKEIAAARNLSIHTIITHRKNIFRKLEVNNVHEATKYALRAGIIDVAEYYI